MTDRITIKDIAKELGIHHSTVSRALRNDSSVKEETRVRIVNYANDHGYQVNINALKLRGSVRNVIAIVVPNINHTFFSNVVSIITDLAYKDGFTVSVFQSNENYEREVNIVNTLIQNRVAGVIASLSMETKDVSHFSTMQEYKIPLVLFDRTSVDLNVSRVETNNYEVINSAVNMLLAKGYDRISHITGTPNLNVFADRQKGYFDAIHNSDIDFESNVIINKAFTVEEGVDAVKLLFSKEEKPNALLCDSYKLTLGVILAVKELGLQIPEDVAIVGYGNEASVDVITPTITTIVQPDDQVAKVAFELLTEVINNPEADKPQNIIVKSKIVERESS